MRQDTTPTPESLAATLFDLTSRDTVTPIDKLSSSRSKRKYCWQMQQINLHSHPGIQAVRTEIEVAQDHHNVVQIAHLLVLYVPRTTLKALSVREDLKELLDKRAKDFFKKTLTNKNSPLKTIDSRGQ
ncbi:hypothetical protein Trydic_g7217 [Trypoxylus dichotomus]